MELSERKGLSEQDKQQGDIKINLKTKEQVERLSHCLKDGFDNKDLFLIGGKRQTYKSRALLTFMTLNIALSSFYFGYCLIYFSQVDTQTILDLLQFNKLGENAAKGLLNGCIPIGCLFGALSLTMLIRNFSRRNCLLVVNLCAFIVGGLIYIQNFYSLLCFRFCQGVFVGMYSALAPLIIKELAPTEISGTLGSYAQLCITFGISFACIFAYALKKITNDFTGRECWYYLYGFTEVTILIQSIVLLFVFPYETPKYWLLIGKEEQARKLIEFLYKQEYVEMILQEKKIDVKATKQKSSVQSESEENYSPRAARNKIAFGLSIHLAALQQFTGVNAISLYAGDIATRATSGQLSLLMPFLINVEQFIGALAAVFLLIRLGRKTILQFGTLFDGIANILIAVGFLFLDTWNNERVGKDLILAGLFLFMPVFGMTLGPIVWLYIPEIVQPSMLPFSTAIVWVCAALVIILFPILTADVFDSNPAILLFFFAVWCGVSFIFNARFMVQTKDKPEKVIQQQFASLVTD